MRKRAPVRPIAGLALLTAASAACAPAGPRADGPPTVVQPAEPIGADIGPLGPTVQIGLAAGEDEVTVDATGALQVGGTAPGGDDRVATPPCRARPDGGRIQVSCQAGFRYASRGETVRFRGRPGVTLGVGEREYAGELVLRATDDGLTTVNVLALETYLLGVVPHEIGSRPPGEIEAVKAQAVAARTYALGHMGRRRALGFDFWGDVNDQVYRGLEGQDTVAARAVRETRGEVLMYDGRPILAYYHSTCGGRTSAIDEVWRRGPLPYLRSVSDMREGGGAWCESSNRFRWTQRWGREELTDILRSTVGLSSGASLRALRIRGRTTSGRVAELAIDGDDGTVSVYGDSVRWALRTPSGAILNSAAIEDIVESSDASGSYVEVRGGGWGHGIGMCQVGAMGRARGGQDHRTILGAYYPGAKLQKAY